MVFFGGIFYHQIYNIVIVVLSFQRGNKEKDCIPMYDFSSQI